MLDVESASLLRDGADVRLRRQSFDFLRHLVENANRLVTKQELYGAIWGDAVVTNDSLTHCLLTFARQSGIERNNEFRRYPVAAMSSKCPSSRSILLKTPVRANITQQSQAQKKRRPQDFGSAIVLVMIAVLGLAVVAATIGTDGGEQPGLANNARAGRVAIQPMIITDSESAEFVAVADSMFSVALNQYGVIDVVPGSTSTAGSTAELVIESILVEEAPGHLDVRVGETTSEATLWSAQIPFENRPVRQVLEIAAARTAYVIECGLFRRELVERDISIELFGLYMRACDVTVNQERLAVYELSLDIVALAPDDAASHSLVALALTRIADVNGPLHENLHFIEEAESSAEKAIAIDPKFPEGLISKFAYPAVR